MNARWVFLCPGQGSQRVGMGKALYDTYPAARELVDQANDVLGFDLRTILFEGPEDALTKTLNTQPALFVVDVVVGTLLVQHGVTPAATAGHSLGEYAACVLAGAISYVDGLRLTRLRGELMYEAGLSRPGKMAAVLGLTEAEVDAAISGIDGTVVAANVNTPTQIVISGDAAAVEAAVPALQTAGARRAILLPVSGAFHSPLMAPAADGLRRALESTSIVDASIPIVANVSATPLVAADDVRNALIAQLTARVRWVESIERLRDDGYGPFVETGPGAVLHGTLKKIDPSLESVAVGDPDAITALTSRAPGSPGDPGGTRPIGGVSGAQADGLGA